MTDFTPDDGAVLARHGFVLFEDKIVREAEAPITDDVLAEIAARCSGPIPDGLVALWRTAFGGTLDFDLAVDFEGAMQMVSFTELFYPESEGYRDLWGWIDHEAELAEEHDRAWSGKLDYLPFGGFEYLSRLYVKVAPGRDYGAVFAWQKGLPPAWRLRLHDDAIARVADDVPALFRQLAFDADPLTEGNDRRAIADVLDELEVDATLADKLRRCVARAILDWRGPLEAGTIASAPRLRCLALEHAARTNDVALLERLATAGCDLEERLRGGGTAIDHALLANAPGVTRFLLDRGVAVKDGVRNGASHASPRLIVELLERGAEPDVTAALTAISHDQMDSALLIARALLRRTPEAASELIDEAEYRAEDATTSADRIEAGTLGSNVTPAEYRAEAARFRELAARVTRNEL